MSEDFTTMEDLKTSVSRNANYLIGEIERLKLRVNNLITLRRSLLADFREMGGNLRNYKAGLGTAVINIWELEHNNLVTIEQHNTTRIQLERQTARVDLFRATLQQIVDAGYGPKSNSANLQRIAQEAIRASQDLK